MGPIGQLKLRLPLIISRIRMVLPFVLILMLLMRLVWLQLRTYKVEADYRTLVTLSYLKLGSEGCAIVANPTTTAIIDRFLLNKKVGTTPEYQRFRSLGMETVLNQFCNVDHKVKADDIVRLNMWIFVVTSIVATAFVRLLSNSWVLGITAAVVLLSRGELISNIGELGVHGFLTLGLSLSILFISYFFVSGSWLSFSVAMLCAVITCSFDAAGGSVVMAFICFLLTGSIARKFISFGLLKRFRDERRRLDTLIASGKLRVYQGGMMKGIIRAFVFIVTRKTNLVEATEHTKIDRLSPGFFDRLDQPFAIWITKKNRLWSIYAFAFLTLFCVVYISQIARVPTIPEAHWIDVLITFAKDHFWSLKTVWISGWLSAADLHLAASLTMIVATAFQSPAKGMRSIFEVSWLFLFTIVFCTLTCLILDLIDLSIMYGIEHRLDDFSILAWSRASKVIVWFDPMILSMGIVSAYQLLLIFQRGESVLFRRLNKL
jgi:hypothetical protein